MANYYYAQHYPAYYQPQYQQAGAPTHAAYYPYAAYSTTQQYGATPIATTPTTTPYAPIAAAATSAPAPANTTATQRPAPAAPATKPAPAVPALDNSSYMDVIGSAGVDIRVSSYCGSSRGGRLT